MRVDDLPDLFSEEGYASMSLDAKRNRFFILALCNARREGAVSYVEVGPGADAKLTRYILDVGRRVGMPDDTRVVAIEANARSLERAREALRGYGGDRVQLRGGDAAKLLPGMRADCLVAEVVGFVASCEGQCRLVRAASSLFSSSSAHSLLSRFVPLRFGTFLCPYSGPVSSPLGEEGDATGGLYRCRHASFRRKFGTKHVGPSLRLVLEDWDSASIVAAEGRRAGESLLSPRVFESHVLLSTPATAFVGFVELRQREEDVWCSSAPWAEAAHRATNWDVSVLQLPRPMRGRVSLRSEVSAFGPTPTYALSFEDEEGTRVRFRFGLRELVEAVRV
jgi:hypothetical protein